MPTATCPSCGDQSTWPTMQAASDWCWQHDQHHRFGDAAIHQLPQITFREQALTAIRALAVTGKPFTIGDAHSMVTAAPVNPRTEWPAVTREARDRGWIVEHGFTQSIVPTTRSSAVKQWIGTAAAARGAA